MGDRQEVIENASRRSREVVEQDERDARLRRMTRLASGASLGDTSADLSKEEVVRGKDLSFRVRNRLRELDSSGVHFVKLVLRDGN